MSLVNLAHCLSHLQNASHFRLGLTSIPYTRMHLSLSLLLHKQGFISYLKLAGLSPPASCFPPGQRDSHAYSAHPHADRSNSSGEAALAEMVFRGKQKAQLVEQGFDQESLDWAVENRELSKTQLESDGWDTKAIDFLIEHGHKSPEQLETEEFDAQAIQITQKYNLATVVRDVESLARHILDQDLQDKFRVRLDQLSESELEKRLQPILKQQVRIYLRDQGFDVDTLKYFAGPHKFVTPTHLHRDGISVSAMGLTITNQPFTAPLPPAYRDPWNLETEGIVTQSNRSTRRLWLGMKYWDGLPVLKKARLISKPTKRIWLDSNDWGKVVRGMQAGEVKGMRQVGEIVAVSTDRGIMEARECVEKRVGGMALCRVW